MNSSETSTSSTNATGTSVGDTHEQETHSCPQELQQAKERYRYVLADFDNYRRHVEKERASWTSNAQNAVLMDVVAIADDFDRAHQDVQNTGFEMIHKSFLKVLAKYGIEEITENVTFDPELHEAIAQIPVEGKESGTVIEIVKKGYRSKGIVLRPAQVVVAQ